MSLIKRNLLSFNVFNSEMAEKIVNLIVDVMFSVKITSLALILWSGPTHTVLFYLLSKIRNSCAGCQR